MKPNEPVFIVGVGRSGSSIFHEILSEHPNVAWLSALCDRYPTRPSVNRTLMNAVDLPAIGPLLKRRYPPEECYRFWDFHFGGFSVPHRDLRAEDLTRKTATRLRRTMSRLASRKRNRLTVKVTGWPRIGFLHALSPDAKFVHILRDGRAVSNSLLGVDWWWGWRGPENWRFGALPESYRREWENHDRSFVALAALEWKLILDAVERAEHGLDSRSLLEVRYEDLCARPISAMRKVTDFCELPWTEGFEGDLRENVLESRNDKWRNDLTAAQQSVLQEILGERLERHGYG